MPALSVDKMPLPGAAKSTKVPKFEKLDFPPWRVVEATVITPAQLAGVALLAFTLLLPAATTTAPRARAELMAAWLVLSQAPEPPSERFNTLAGVALAGAPDTAPPDAQIMPSAMSEV